MEFGELEVGDGAPSRTLKNGATGHARQAGGHPRGVEIRRSLAAPGIPRSVSAYHFRRRASEERMDTSGITQNPSSSSPSVDPIVGTVQLGIPPGGPIVSEHHEIGDANIEGIMLQISAEFLGDGEPHRPIGLGESRRITNKHHTNMSYQNTGHPSQWAEQDRQRAEQQRAEQQRRMDEQR